MILSRSRRQGLKAGQVFVMFDFQPDHVKLTGQLTRRSLESVVCRAPVPSAEVISVLRELEACPID
jgi:hypothetical protein